MARARGDFAEIRANMRSSVFPEIVSIPIREGVTVRIALPLDITRGEAGKVARVVAALANLQK